MADRPLPGWPRVLREPLAAGYVGLSASAFRTHVATQVPAIHLTKRTTAWLREDLDAWLDGRRGDMPASQEDNPWPS